MLIALAMEVNARSVRRARDSNVAPTRASAISALSSFVAQRGGMPIQFDSTADGRVSASALTGSCAFMANSDIGEEADARGAPRTSIDCTSCASTNRHFTYLGSVSAAPARRAVFDVVLCAHVADDSGRRCPVEHVAF